MTEADTRPSLGAWSDWASAEATAAVGADIEKLLYYAVSAERAFVGANIRLGRLWRQVFITAFAVRF